VTLYATGDSVTKAKLRWIIAMGYEEDKRIDPKVAEVCHIARVFEEAGEFDLIHNHFDFLPLTYARLVATPVLTTIHGFSSPKILPVYQQHSETYYVSISNADRAKTLNYLATVYNGIDLTLHEYFAHGGEHLVFLSRIHPDKGVHLAVETAVRARRKLVMAGIIQDEMYFKTKIKPRINGRDIKYIGPVGPRERNALFKDAYALLHLNTRDERFGLVLAEAGASGVPVIAMDRGSCREVIAEGRTGFLVNSVTEAVTVLSRVRKISRKVCRTHVEEHFSLEKMVSDYERVYERIFKLEEQKTSKRGHP